MYTGLVASRTMSLILIFIKSKICIPGIIKPGTTYLNVIAITPPPTDARMVATADLKDTMYWHELQLYIKIDRYEQNNLHKTANVQIANTHTHAHTHQKTTPKHKKKKTTDSTLRNRENVKETIMEYETDNEKAKQSTYV